MFLNTGSVSQAPTWWAWSSLFSSHLPQTPNSAPTVHGEHGGQGSDFLLTPTPPLCLFKGRPGPAHDGLVPSAPHTTPSTDSRRHCSRCPQLARSCLTTQALWPGAGEAPSIPLSRPPETSPVRGFLTYKDSWYRD